MPVAAKVNIAVFNLILNIVTEEASYCGKGKHVAAYFHNLVPIQYTI